VFLGSLSSILDTKSHHIHAVAKEEENNNTNNNTNNTNNNTNFEMLLVAPKV